MVCVSRYHNGVSWRPTGRCCPRNRRTISRSFSARISALYWRFSKRNARGIIQARNDAYDAAYDFGLIGNAPGFREAAGKRVRLHHEARSILVKPAAAVTASDFNEVHRPIV